MTVLSITHPRYGRGQATAVVSHGIKKIHTTFAQGTEMMEEFDAATDQLKCQHSTGECQQAVRRLRHRSDIGAQGPWEYEIGDPVHSFNPAKDLIAESSVNPIFSRHDSPSHFIFRIRNLPYPVSTYQLSVAPTAITLQTSNRKYYKQISIAELTTPLTADSMKWEHSNSTLIIWYTKPQPVKDREEAEKQQRKLMT